MAEKKSKRVVKSKKTRAALKTPDKPKNSKQNPNKPAEPKLTVVGIGASAGGLNPIQKFFEDMPVDTGMSFVVVTHLHPEFESHLPDLIQARTEMQVTQVTKQVPIEPDHVYVIPPNRNIVVTDSALSTTEFEEPRGHRTPIDGFFRSLAKAHHGAIAVILSGGGTDGAVGVKDVKEVGGLLLVQHPDEAEYDSMPNAAIQTGIADVILPVTELVDKLVDYHRHIPQVPSREEELSEKDLDTIQRILAQVHARTGHDFNQYKRSTVLRRIQRRMQLNGYGTLTSYLKYLRTNASEAALMFNDILIGVTNFFRDRASWEALEQNIIPKLFQDRGGGETIRVWSLGCATGEEAYSLAILLLEQAAKMDTRVEIQVFASDLDDGSLIRAREGVYPAVIEADVSQERLQNFFTVRGDHYAVKRELRDVVLFTNHSVLRDPPFSHVDLIACRNVLIYLQRHVQDSVFDIFNYALNPMGYLFLGNSESAEQVPHLFETVDKRNRIYQARIWRGERPHLPLPMTPGARPRAEARIVSRPNFSRRSIDPQPALDDQHQKALEEYAPASMLVNEDFNILHISETAGRYLMQPRGPITTDLLRLIRSELQLELRAALFQAFEKDKSVISKPVPVQFNGHARLVVLSVLPRRVARDQRVDERQALVVFLEDEFDEHAGNGADTTAHSQARNDAMVAQMETEIQRLREQLQATLEEFESSNEEMKAANEELQSINEEYRSATEELETSKEELQSVNEELQTVNQELKSKLDEISRAHSDLENLMASTEVATLFLDRQLRIQRFTPPVTTLFNIMPSDRGRPLAHLTNTIDYPNLVEDTEQVLRKLVPVEHEIKGEGGRWFLVRQRPYRTMEDKIDGVVITIIDITPIKNAEETQRRLNHEMAKSIQERTQELDLVNHQLGLTRDMFYTLFHSNPCPTLLVRKDDTRLINVNLAFLNTFGLQRDRVIGRLPSEINFDPSFLSLEKRMSDIPQLEVGLNVRTVELQVTHPNSREMMTVLASFQDVNVDNTDATLVTFLDISERVRAEQEIRALAASLNNAEQAERHRISQVLHDDLQQRLFAIKAQLSLINKNSERTDVKQLEEQLGEAISVTRNLRADISPAILQGEGLADALSWLAEQMQEHYGLEVVVNTNNDPARMDENLRVTLFRIVRELLFNIYKHSGQEKSTVTLEPREDGWLRITVRDSGRGFNAEAFLKDPRKAGGLLNMRHRLQLLGGRMEVISKPGDGSLVHLDVPVKAGGAG
jgi:two-component system CheB/CheR fusion protein